MLFLTNSRYQYSDQVLDSLSIPYQRLRFRFLADTRIAISGYKGSPFRGLFGYAFKRLVCPFRSAECDTCLLKHSCLYLAVFETPSDAKQILHRTGPNRSPHPFVLTPPLDRREWIPPGDEFTAEITLMGMAMKALPHMALTFREMGSLGIGKNRAKFHLTAGEAWSRNGWVLFYKPGGKIEPSNIPTCSFVDEAVVHTTSRSVTLRTVTPMRLKKKGRLVTDLIFQHLIGSLLRRLDDLARLYGSGPLPVDIPALIKRSETVEQRQYGMSWIDFERYSSRQNTRMRIGGLEGEVCFEGDLAPFVPWLTLGAALHVGKATSFGFGRYRLSWS